jgi:hypothetical protein
MQPRAMIAVLLVSILIFGCTSPSSNVGTTPTPGGSTPGQPAANTTPAGNQTPAGNGSVTPSGGEPNGGQPSGGTGDLTGKSFTELAALGVPIQCDINTSSGLVKVYKGTGMDMRSEMSVSAGSCQKVVTIIKGDKYYVGCSQGVFIPGSSCQWLEFSTNSTSSGSPGAYQEPDYNNVPAVQISCVPWILDASMLQAPASACTLQDLMNNIPTS